ncbi:PREDICTED: uncharacterized protein LOC105450615 [Wasmannia auropunctata]|uniref:uncharacterized protein LOC105450615 n=1 Tax=Wasmannia auropunctata TaxID=64793 RepID=UPI0005F06B31|nr:PREDICTED: uncharacterized protein LOC105450615 [Wasmannia auropunctata]
MYLFCEDNIIEQAEENIQEAEIPNEEEDFDVTNFPENENLRKIFIEERLIEAVRRRPPLWNFKLPVAQRGVRNKEKLWKDVVAVMKGVVTLAEAKKKWKSLSDVFRRHRKNAELPSGSTARKMKKWVHYDRMNFLLDIDLLQSEYV